jgi:alanine dehydrogenase
VRIGLLRETKVDERRVALLPSGARALVGDGHEVVVEQNAGIGSGFTDDDYLSEGATIVESADKVIARAQMLLKVKEPSPWEASQLRSDHIVFAYLHLAAQPELAEALRRSGATCVAYETVTDRAGRLPLLAPMSEIAGRLAAQAAAWALEAHNGGCGVLLGGAPGVKPARVLVVGGGAAGANAAQVSAGLGADVMIVEANPNRLRALDLQFAGTSVRTLAADQVAFEHELTRSHAVIGAVLVTGARAPRILKRSHLSLLRPGAVVVDVSIDQGGCFETSRPTTHARPLIDVDGIIHYCVANMPGAVPHTSTRALTNATLPYVRRLAEAGCHALVDDPHFAAGLNVLNGDYKHPAVAAALEAGRDVS